MLSGIPFLGMGSVLKGREGGGGGGGGASPFLCVCVCKGGGGAFLSISYIRCYGRDQMDKNIFVNSHLIKLRQPSLKTPLDPCFTVYSFMV